MLLLALGLAASGCGCEAASRRPRSSAKRVVLNRNRVDFVLGRITRAAVDRRAADAHGRGFRRDLEGRGELEDTGAPSDYQPEADDLVTSLRQLSVDIQATADQARVPGFEYLLTDAALQGLSFDSWDDANKALAGLAGKGIEVSILQPKGGE